MARTISGQVISSITTDSGSSSTDFITSDKTLTLSGTTNVSTGSGNGTLGIWLSGGAFGTGTLVGSVNFNSSGTNTAWSFNLTTSTVNSAKSLADGTYTITVTNGTSSITSSPVTHTLTEDTTAPTAAATVTALSADTGSSGSDYITKTAAQTVSGTYTGTLGSGESIQVSANGTTFVTATASGGTFSASGVTLSAGINTLTVQTIDAAGNVLAGTGHSYTLDTTAPTAAATVTALSADTGSSSTDYITKTAAQTVSGTYTGTLGAGESIQVSADGSTFVTATANSGTHTWSASGVTLSSGSNTLTVQTVDTAGNVLAGTGHSYTLDATGPSETISSTITTNTGATGTISSGGATKDNTLGLSGTVSDTSGVSSVQVFDGATLLGSATVSAGNWSFTTGALGEGSHSFTATATDTAGNTTTTSAVTATVDTTAPSETISSTIATDTGATGTISSGGLTKDNTLGLSGTVSDTNLSTVQVFDGAVLLGSAVVSAGNWSFTTGALGEGSHSFTAKATDTAGNSTTPSAVTATVDTTAPSETISSTITTNTGATGTIVSGGVTKDNTLGLSGTVSDANGVSSVQVFDGATLLGTADVSAGNWSFTTGALDDGSHSFTATATDTAGNTTTTSAVTATVDTTAPSETIDSTIATDTGATGTISSGDLTKDNTLGLSGTVSDANGVSSVQVFDGATLLGTADVSAGNWSFTTGALDDGSHSFTATATDTAGNTTTTSAVTATVDATAPSETIDSTIATDTGATGTISSGGVTKDNTLGLSGTVSDANGVSSVQVFDGATLLGTADVSAGNWSFTTGTLGDGSHSFTAKATDTAGNSTTPSAVTATVDTTAPSETIDSTIATDTGATGTISSGDLTKDNTLGLSGTVSDANLSSVQVFDGATLLGTADVSAGNWSFTTGTLDDGSHSFTATATDTAGNTTTTSAVTATIDTTAPSETIDSTIATDTGATGTIVSGGLTKDNTLGLSGTVSDANGVSSVEVFDGATLLGTADVSAGNWSFTTGALDDGSHSFTATATDTAGNTTTTSAVTATVDATAPSETISNTITTDTGATGTISSGGLTKDNTLGLSGTVSDANGVSSVQVFDGATLLGTADVSAGNWSFTTGALDDGSHSFTATATDTAGNTTTTSAVIATVDTAVDVGAVATLTVDDPIISGAKITTVPVTIAGLAGDETAIVTFTDSALNSVTSGPIPLGNGTFSADLTGLVDGKIITTMVITDTAGNTANVAAATTGYNPVLNTTPNLSLSFNQFLLWQAELGEFSSVTLKDTAFNISNLTDIQIASLGSAGVDFLQSTSGAFTLNYDQYEALLVGSVALTPSDVVTLRATNADLSGFAFSTLQPSGIDKIDAAGDNTLMISLAQYGELGAGLTLTNADVVTLFGDGAALAALSPSDFAGMAAKGIDFLLSSTIGSTLTLDVAQVQALGTVKFAPVNTVTVADDGATLSALTSSQIFALANKGVVALQATSGDLTLTRLQYQALGAMTLSAAGEVVLADSSGQLAALTASQFAGLATTGVDRIDSLNNIVQLSLADYQALGTVALTGSDVVTLADTNANLTGLDFSTLQAGGIDKIDATDNTLTINLAQYGALGAGLALTNADVVTLADSGAALSALLPADISALAGKGIDKLNATDNAITLSLAQFNALGTVALSSDDALTLTGTSGNDGITFSRQPFNVNDQIDGGAGTADNIALNGDYGALVVNASTIVNVETLTLSGGHNYNLTLNDGNVAAGQSLKVNGSKLGALDSLVFNGSAETDGSYNFIGGAGTNSFTGGSRGDLITAGGGVDTINYTAASQSTSTNYDTVTGFNAAFDKFDVGHHVAGIDSAVSGALSTSTFDAQLAAAVNGSHLQANDAVLFTATSGNLSGQIFLVVDMNGTAGYQAGADLAVKMSGTVGTVGASNFS